MKYSRTVEALKRRGFDAVEVSTGEEAAAIVMKEAEAASSVGWGGSESVKAIGVRERLCARYAMEREQGSVQSAYGQLRVKRSRGYGVTREKPEYEDLARLARENGVSLRQVRESMQD